MFEMPLADKNCVPCKGGVPRLTGDALAELEIQLPAWKVVDEHHLYRKFTFPDFGHGLMFVNRVAAIAEEQGHHPDLLLAWGRVEITIYTHKIGGLTEGDFILAAKIDRISQETN